MTSVVDHSTQTAYSNPGRHRSLLEDILGIDQQRHSAPLHAERAPEECVQGCCRDHTLFCVGALRSQGIRALSRVEYASWIDPVSDLLLAADTGDLDAEKALYTRYCWDPDLRPANLILRGDPFGGPPVEADLTR